MNLGLVKVRYELVWVRLSYNESQCSVLERIVVIASQSTISYNTGSGDSFLEWRLAIRSGISS